MRQGRPAYDYYGNVLADGKNDIGANEYTAEAADKSGLEAVISAAEALDASDYTADSYAAVTEALEAAKAVLQMKMHLRKRWILRQRRWQQR